MRGAAAPPPPPSADPAPVVVEAGNDDPTALGAFHGIVQPWDLGDMARGRHLEWLERGWSWVFVWPDHPATEIVGFVTQVAQPDPRLASFRAEFGPAAERLLAALARGLAGDGSLALGFPAPRS